MKNILVLMSLWICGSVTAQDFQGMAVYESKTSIEEMMKNMPQNKEITPEMRQRMQERLKKAMEKTFILNFDRTTSIYKEEEKLETPGQSGGMMRFGGGDGTYYKNVKEQRYTSDKEFFGKEFLVKDTLRNFKWVMGSETRTIGNYTCFKATAVIPIDDSDFRDMRFRNRDKEKEEEAKKAETKKDSTKTTNFFENMEIPKEKTITAWYTPEIPINQGPDEYWGLPGLILEVNDGRTTILCSKIVLNPKEKVAIKEPTKGKEVSQQEFNKTIIKKMEEMREQFQNKRGERMGPPH